MSFTHEIKAWPEFYQKMESGELPFNIRRDDRGYDEGDTLIVSEFEPDMTAVAVNNISSDQHPSGRFTGRKLKRRINRIFSDLPGLQPGYVAMTLLPVVER